MVLEGATALTSTFTWGQLSHRAKIYDLALVVAAKALRVLGLNPDLERFVLPTILEPSHAALNCRDSPRWFPGGVSIEVP